MEKIYLERKNKMIELIKTMSWEEAREIVDGMDFQERIDKIVYPSGKKKDPETLGKWTAIYRIVGTNNNHGGKYDCKRNDTTINGNAVYSRVFIKRIGYELDLGGGYAEVILDNADEEDINWFLNNDIELITQYEK